MFYIVYPDRTSLLVWLIALGEETLLFKRVLNIHGKEKTRQSILLFLNALQRKIVERKIRKTSPNANLIEGIQKWAVNTYNKMGKTIRVSIDNKTLERLREVTGSEQVRESVRLLKRYIGMHGKQVDSDKATRLYNAIVQAKKKKKITQADPYFKYVQEVSESLKSYGCHMGTEPLKISATALQGLQGVLGLEGLEPGTSAGEDLHQDTRIISSVDLMGLEFETLGFTGKWLDFIGDPTPGFSVLIYGAPKFGKSYLAVEFAGYLAANHGRVLYLTKEEGIGHTIQDKVREKGVAHPNLLIASGYIPGDLSGYDFIFLDSITKLKLSPDDLLRMKEENPGVSFVYISQVTQDGRARGSKEFEHDVDVIIHVPEKGYAIQNGRFNQGGEMEIFEP
ncbi:hypothetical protein JMN32_01820 [Fulvivirga sp. 29W222]|uniref:AAA+ ATPase domain-containing protein n=1 Tax=Fulvivirga marina TaxID=2494733 RepID=A0A937FUB3_9BACT|nr:hypothetical protein [Fulvivirga marina]MBL6445027.1 hypothetical protein [Fulvivirga marina]